MVLGGFAAYRYYRHVTDDAKSEFNKRVDHLEMTYHQALDELTRKERNRLTQYGTQVLTPVFSRLEALNKRYSEQHKALNDFVERVNALRTSVEKTK
jgi:uncharacterized coiled-coil protein SlyX